MLAGGRHFTVGGGLPAVRETQSHLNNDRFADAVVESARFEGANAD